MFHHCKRIVPMAPWRFLVQYQNSAPVARNFWNSPRPSDFRSVIRDMDRTMQRFEREFLDRTPFRNFFPRCMVPIEGVEQRGDAYRLNVNVDGFKPEEIKISLKDNVLTITAKMERKVEDGSKYQQEFTREITLPENVDAAELKSFLNIDGVLSIEAAYKPGENPKEIPVNREK